MSRSAPARWLADPLEGRPLREADGLLRNAAGVWPVLGGVPILVPEPASWLAAHRDAVLAALAEAGRCTPGDVERLDAFAGTVRAAPSLVPDDFLADEEASAALHDALAADCRGRPVLEVGAGSGALTRRVRPAVVVDRSLRAALRATAGTDALPVVGLAEALPVRRRAFGTVVAANVVDLLDDPGAFVLGAAAALRSSGRLVLCTPDPALGVRDGPEGALAELVETAGLVVEDESDGHAWVRVHGPRHREEYVVRRIVATRGPLRR